MDENARRAEPKDATAIMREAMVTSALESAAQAVEFGLSPDKIILSCKVSGVQDLIAIYADLAGKCDYPLHLGLTEAGMGSKGIVASSAAMGVLLQQGIGDTIRVSLTPEPNGDRTKEVVVAQELLQTMGLRAFTPLVAACPGCGRTTSTYFQELAQDVQTYVRDKMPAWRLERIGVENMTLRRDGLCGQRTWRKQARQYRHQPAGHGRIAGGAGICRRRAYDHAQGRRSHRRIQRASLMDYVAKDISAASRCGGPGIGFPSRPPFLEEREVTTVQRPCIQGASDELIIWRRFVTAL